MFAPSVTAALVLHLGPDADQLFDDTTRPDHRSDPRSALVRQAATDATCAETDLRQALAALQKEVAAALTVLDRRTASAQHALDEGSLAAIDRDLAAEMAPRWNPAPAPDGRWIEYARRAEAAATVLAAHRAHLHATAQAHRATTPTAPAS